MVDIIGAIGVHVGIGEQQLFMPLEIYVCMT
jgi:hypothetical protein